MGTEDADGQPDDRVLQLSQRRRLGPLRQLLRGRVQASLGGSRQLHLGGGRDQGHDGDEAEDGLVAHAHPHLDQQPHAGGSGSQLCPRHFQPRHQRSVDLWSEAGGGQEAGELWGLHRNEDV